MKRGPLYQVQADAGATFVESDGWTVPADFGSAQRELGALKTMVGLTSLEGWGILRLRGSSRLDFVHRMSTNDVLKSTPGQVAPTVFATPIGRTVDLTYVLTREDDLLLVTGRGADEKVSDWLCRHIFFNDDVLVENITAQRVLLSCSGPFAGSVMSRLVDREMADLNRFHTRRAEIDGVDVTVAAMVPLGNDFLLVSRVEDAVSLWQALLAAVEAAGGVPAGESALETQRVGEGLPRFGRELTEDYIPLEAGLKWAVSFNKGCYVGQEIIARVETYQKLAKRLVVLGCAPHSGAAARSPAAADEVWWDKTKVGHVTSVAPLPEDGVVKALAYVKTSAAQLGLELAINSSLGELAASVLAVPGADG